MKAKTIQQLDTYQQQQVAYIRKVKPDIYTILRHVSSSGMSRVISAHYIKDNRIIDITHLVADLTGRSIDRNYFGVKIGGCGMDMGFALIYSFSHALFPTGYKHYGDQCHSNDHANGKNAEWHTDGGYALEQRWL